MKTAAYLVRMLYVDTETEFLEDSSFRLYHLILQIDVVLIKYQRRDRSNTKQPPNNFT